MISKKKETEIELRPWVVDGLGLLEVLHGPLELMGDQLVLQVGGVGPRDLGEPGQCLGCQLNYSWLRGGSRESFAKIVAEPKQKGFVTRILR